MDVIRVLGNKFVWLEVGCADCEFVIGEVSLPCNKHVRVQKTGRQTYESNLFVVLVSWSRR